MDEDEEDLTEKQKLRVVKNTFKALQKQLKGSQHFKAATTAIARIDILFAREAAYSRFSISLLLLVCLVVG